MPDPIEELENFTSPGLTMDPMPASEVRRRGTRMHRRNTALATVGGIAAIAVIAAPFAVFAGQNDQRDLEPAPPVVQWEQTIPEGFPLTDQMFGDPEVTGDAGFQLIEPCGVTAWSSTRPVATVDLAGATYEENENGQGRTLALYKDEADATRALDEIDTAIGACPSDPNGQGADQQLDLQPGSLGDESVAFSQRSVDGSGLMGDLTVVQAVRVGNALLLTSSWGAGGSSDDRVTEELVNLTTQTSGVVDDMCVFSAEGCGENDVALDPGSDSVDGAATVIPDSFDLLAGLPTDGATGDFGRVGPDREIKRIQLDACGTPGPAPDSLDLLRGGFTAPEGERQRQLMTFADEGAAQAYVDDVAGLFPCTVDGSQGMVGEFELADSELGDSAVTAFLRFTVDGEPGLGYEIVHAVRVGQSVLLSRVRVDGDSTPVTDEVRAQLLADTAAELTDVVADMCVFSDDGC